MKFESIVSSHAPIGMAFDSINSHLYWTEDSTTGTIMRCNSEGSDVTFIYNATKPSVLALDINNRFVL